MQEARYQVAMKDLEAAQTQLDEKQRELDVVKAQYDAAMAEKQVIFTLHFNGKYAFGLWALLCTGRNFREKVPMTSQPALVSTTLELPTHCGIVFPNIFKTCLRHVCSNRANAKKETSKGNLAI